MTKCLLILIVLVTACTFDESGVVIHPGAPDAGVDASSDVDADTASAQGPEVYPINRPHSPITPYVADNLRMIAGRAQAPDKVFAKVGDEHTTSPHFMRCFASADVKLNGRDDLAATVTYFMAGDAAGTNAFQRVSFAAGLEWIAGDVLVSDPTRLMDEVLSINPRFAVVMFGTHDVVESDTDTFGSDLLTIADKLIERGVVPIFTTVPGRNHSVDADAKVRRFNTLVRAVAQARQVPLIDYHHALQSLPNRGLDPDGVRPSVSTDLGSCNFTSVGLQFGYNVRNLLTIEALHRLKRVTVDRERALDAPQRGIKGTGAPNMPVLINQLPFVDVRDTSASVHSNLDEYVGCDAPQDESGPELIYKLTLNARTTIRAMVIDRGDVDIDVHLLGGPLVTEIACIARGHQGLTYELDPGTHHFVLDTFTADGTPRAGEYVFVVMDDTSEFSYAR